jgi:hypothetical protein
MSPHCHEPSWGPVEGLLGWRCHSQEHNFTCAWPSDACRSAPAQLVSQEVVCVLLCVLLCVPQAMSRPFAAGADRLADLETVESPVSGCPVLVEAHATMDCSVVSGGKAGAGSTAQHSSTLASITIGLSLAAKSQRYIYTATGARRTLSVCYVLCFI